ncbi:MAG: transketolase [Gammaproteobacteria bacterium]|nr:transketolase [Gammaproteobacteria bacterium]
MTTTRSEKANAIRALSMDAVQKAKSGHPGMPMGMADIAEVLWSDYLKHNPSNPNWIDRDRFVLSNGHGSMLLYALLHLTGYDLSMGEIKNFRQLHSKTPGHPEYGDTPGVETTTGPLGQGLANAVGMALAERTLAAQFNRSGHDITNHFTYVFAGDGCLMEGISHEACSFAGTQGLGKLIVLYDDNGISIDGDVTGWFTDDTRKRFEAYGWQVVPNVDGHDSEAIRQAIKIARFNRDQPTLICCKTVIGFGSPNKAGKESAHGAPLGDDEIQLVREQLNWKHEPFVIPDEIYTAWNAKQSGVNRESEWNTRFKSYQNAHPELAAELVRRCSGELPQSWGKHADTVISKVNDAADSIATRKASQNALNEIAPVLPELIGGSADLTGSNLTQWKESEVHSSTDSQGAYIFYGVREFGMAAISNGITLHDGFKSFCATFLMFSEYARNALRMAALMKLPNVFVFTHDSIGLGEDGPTHQAVEQTASLRLIPNMSVWRPCDAVESAVAWRVAIERRDGPSCLLFSRQNLAHQKRNNEQLENIKRGGYVLWDCQRTPDVILISTGSEVELAMQAAQSLGESGYQIRVVSMPSTDIFDRQDAAYRESVLPGDVKTRIAIEAGVTDGWRKYVGLEGRVMGIDSFGVSAPASDAFEYFSITADNLIEVARELIETTLIEQSDVDLPIAANN